MRTPDAPNAPSTGLTRTLTIYVKERIACIKEYRTRIAADRLNGLQISKKQIYLFSVWYIVEIEFVPGLSSRTL